MKKPENPHPTESGQSLVELAMSLMFLFILLAGAVDLGRAFFTYIALRDAAQEGAAYASIARSNQSDGMKCSDIVARVQSTSTTQIVNLADTSVSILLDGILCTTPPNKSNACYGRAVEVIVHYADFRLTTPLLGTIIGSQTVPITASIIDTVLTPPCH
jgi:Flp pilus assembly protein TadG